MIPPYSSEYNKEITDISQIKEDKKYRHVEWEEWNKETQGNRLF